MESLLAAHIPFRKGVFHDTPSPTRVGRHASAQSLPAYPGLSRVARLSVRTLFQEVAGSPGPGEIRSYQVYLTIEKKLAPGSIIIAVSALRFLYKVTLHKDWTVEDIIPAPKKPQKLPVVLSPEEVRHFLSCIPSLKHRTILTVCYAAGLRISEVTRLKPIAIDS